MWTKFAVMLGTTVAILEAGAVHAQAPKRPNVLWLLAEDMSPRLGCYGYKGVATPNLDRLGGARGGLSWAVPTAPGCSPSRSAFMTGMYQTTIGAHNHRSHRDDGFQLPDGVRVFTLWLQD